MERKAKYLAAQLVAHSHNLPKLRELLQDADINDKDERGYTLMHFIANLGNADLLKLLQSYHADANICDRYGEVPLHIATKAGHIKAVNMLIKMTSSINIQDRYGDSALHLAAKQGDIAIIKLLIRAGAVLNTINEHGLTPLAMAEENNHTAAVVLLQNQGGKKTMSIMNAIKYAYKAADMISKFCMSSFSVCAVGSSIIATIATSGELALSILGAVGASLGLAMVCLEKPYRKFRITERYNFNHF